MKNAMSQNLAHEAHWSNGEDPVKDQRRGTGSHLLAKLAISPAGRRKGGRAVRAAVRALRTQCAQCASYVRQLTQSAAPTGILFPLQTQLSEYPFISIFSVSSGTASIRLDLRLRSHSCTRSSTPNEIQNDEPSSRRHHQETTVDSTSRRTKGH